MITGGLNDLDIDWEQEGKSISENTHLNRGWAFIKKNTQGQLEDKNAIRNVKTLYSALSKNGSIRDLSIDEGRIDLVDAFTILSPFFEHNHNLRKLYIDARSLEDESAAKLVNILGESRNLRELVLCFNNNGKKWCIELGVLLLQNGLKLDMQQLIEVAIP